MTQIAETSGGGARSNDARIISLVCAAHFVSHFYILVLPPLFPFVRDFYSVSYTELGLALTCIGKFEGQGLNIIKKGDSQELVPHGWDHLRP